MGSGSYGGGGGGGGGSGGGGRTGGYRFQDGKALNTVEPLSKVEKEAKRIFSKLSGDYLAAQFCSPMVRALYEQLFELSIQVFQNRSWEGMARRYGVSGDAGCLLQWVSAVIAQFQETEPNQKVRDTARVCLEDFLMFAMGNDVDLYVSGSSEDILKKLEQKIFNSTSGYFLGLMTWRVLERERETLRESAEVQLRDAAQKIADRIIHSFEGKFYARGQITYRDLFRVINDNRAWFLEELRR